MNVAELHIPSVIAELLYAHNCVIIPGFGGLVGNRVAAHLDSNKNTFYPPYKKLVFNSHLQMNDGLLATALSTQKQVPYNEALAAVDALVKSWNSRLQKGQEITLNEIGKFKKSKDNSIAFHQDFSVNYLAEAFGMQAIHVAATQRGSIKEKISRQIIDSTIPSAKNTSTWMKVAAVIAAPIAATALFFAMNLPHNASTELNWNPFTWSTSEQALPALPANPDVTITIVRPEDFFNKEEVLKIYTEKLTEPKMELSTSVVKELPSEKTTTLAENHYHVIAGCFAEEQNAALFLAELKAIGFAAEILPKTPNALIRVTYGSYNNKLDALKGLASARLKHSPNAWMSEGN